MTEPGKKSKSKYTWSKPLGAAFIAMGVPGLIIPFMPGLLFILVGIALATGRERILNQILDRLLRRSRKDVED